MVQSAALKKTENKTIITSARQVASLLKRGGGANLTEILTGKKKKPTKTPLPPNLKNSNSGGPPPPDAMCLLYVNSYAKESSNEKMKCFVGFVPFQPDDMTSLALEVILLFFMNQLRD